VQNDSDVSELHYSYLDCDGGVHTDVVVAAGGFDTFCTRDPDAIDITFGTGTVTLQGACPP
jgi:hypothetical protein